MKTETKQRPTPGVYAANTSAAIDRLSGGQPGDIVTEEQMTQAIHEPCDPDSPGYSVITRAINYVRRDHNVAWQRDRTIPGWRCLGPSERIKQVKQSGAKRLGRMAKKQLQLLAVDSSKLSAEERRDQQILQVTHTIAAASVHSRFRRQIAAKIANWDSLKAPSELQLIELMRPNGLDRKQEE